MTEETRGERNNNCGNIDYSPRNPWLGQLGIEISPEWPNGYTPRFARFDTPEHGIRALARLLLHYRAEGYDTITKIIEHWAPPSDNNDTEAYIAAVAAQCRYDPTAVLPELTQDILAALAYAIIRQENGRVNYTDDIINAGVAMALA